MVTRKFGKKIESVYVVAQFYPWLNSDFLWLIFFMLMYDNEYKTKENKKWTKDKIELQHVHCLWLK